MFDPLEQAIYDTVHRFRGGAVRLAPRVGMNAGTLSNKANPGMETHQLGLRESVPIQRVSGNFSILHAYAAVLDHVAVKIGDYANCSDVELLDIFAKYCAEFGESAGAIHEALRDRRVTRDEFRKVQAEIFQDFRAGMELLTRLEALIDE